MWWWVAFFAGIGVLWWWESRRYRGTEAQRLLDKYRLPMNPPEPPPEPKPPRSSLEMLLDWIEKTKDSPR